MPMMLANLLDPVLSVLYPPRCSVCRTLGENILCDTCLRGIAPVPEPQCTRCGQALGEVGACRHCSRRMPAFDAARALGAHDGILQHAIHLLKYRDRPALAEPLGVALAAYGRTESSALNSLAFDLIMPVPMHPTRRRLRGYNQAERLARVLARELCLPLDTSALGRRQNTRAQVGLTQDARQRNLANAFVVSDSGKVQGATILIIDDVSTTGSTLHEVAKALKASGAKAVYGLTLAAG